MFCIQNCFHRLLCCFVKYHVCEICNKKFKNKYKLAHHIRTNHPFIFSFGSSVEAREYFDIRNNLDKKNH